MGEGQKSFDCSHWLRYKLIRLKRIMRYILTLIIIICCSRNLAADVNLPVDNFYPGWIKADSLRRFSAPNLYRHINGGAEIFLELGFQELLVQKYQNENQKLKIESYKMESPESALGIYLMKMGRETPHSDISSRNTCNQYQYTLVKGNYFILVYNFTGDSTLLPVMTKLSQAILKQIDHKEIKIFNIMPTQDMKPNTQRIIRGQFTLQALYTFGPRDILNLNGKIFGVSAEYGSNNHSDHTMILVTYPDTKTCNHAFKNLIVNLDSYLVKIKQDRSQLIFKDYKSRYGQVTVSENIMKLVVHLKNPPG